MRYDYDFDNKKAKRNKKIMIIVAIVISLIVLVGFILKGNSNKTLNNISNIFLFPINKTYDVITGISNSAKNNFGNTKKINEENEKLKAENESLKIQILETKKITDENESLKKMLDIKKSFEHFNVKSAKIMYREHDNWTQTFKINLGSDDGIKLNQAVIHKEGLVGFISNVEKENSTVTTILDPLSSVSVNVSTINEPAILQGDFNLKTSNKLKLVFIPLDVEVSMGDMLYTSSLSSIYPSAIPVGKIVEISGNKNDINRYAVVETNVNIKEIKEIAVIVN